MKKPPPLGSRFRPSGKPNTLANTKSVPPWGRAGPRSELCPQGWPGGLARHTGLRGGPLTVRNGCLVFWRTRLSVTVWATSSCRQRPGEGLVSDNMPAHRLPTRGMRGSVLLKRSPIPSQYTDRERRSSTLPSTSSNGIMDPRKDSQWLILKTMR